MKNIYALIVLVFLFSFARAQTFDFVPVYQNHVFKLNSNSSTFLGGVSKVSYPINLPPGASEFYYTVTVVRDAVSVSNSLSLLSQLVNLYDNTGFSSTILNSVVVPGGNSVANVYLLDKNGNDNFLKLFKSFNYFGSFSRERVMQTSVKVDKVGYGNNYYIGFVNPSTIYPVVVRLEVVALVRKW